MAAVMTQTQSPRALLKLDSDETGQTAAQPLLNSATGVFDITPETALSLLCHNIEYLNTFFAQTSEDDSHSSTPAESQTPGEGEDMPVHIAHVHFGENYARAEALQLGIISRRFLSKEVPPIALKDYLLRLHRYCPMSTAVYLATSVYITKMTLVEKVLRVTPRNMHRLVLAGLLVANKALEDRSFQHSRFAKVGGVNNQELSKLEINFCFLADFELRVDAEMLMEEVRAQDSRTGPSADSEPDSSMYVNNNKNNVLE